MPPTQPSEGTVAPTNPQLIAQSSVSGLEPAFPLFLQRMKREAISLSMTPNLTQLWNSPVPSCHCPGNAFTLFLCAPSIFNLSLSCLHPVMALPYVGWSASVFSALDSVTALDSGTNQSHLQVFVPRLLGESAKGNPLRGWKWWWWVFVMKSLGPEKNHNMSGLCTKVKWQTAIFHLKK